MKIKSTAFTLKLISVVLSVSFFLISWGCASPGPQSFHSALTEETRRHTLSVAVVPVTFIPESKFLTYAKGRDSGAKKGATELALDGAIRFGPLFPIGALYGGIVGAILGADLAVPIDDVLKVEAAINSAISDVDVQEKLAMRMVSAGLTFKDYQFSLITDMGLATLDEKSLYRSLNEQNVDMALEVSVRSLGFVGGTGTNPKIAFFMDVNVRVIHTVDETEIYSGESTYISRLHRLSVWRQDGEAVLRQEFETSYARFAEQILENLFLVYDFYIAGRWSPDGHCMLKPFIPPQSGIRFSQVDSLRPTFQWEAFPREEDIVFDYTGVLTRVSDITYDLKIWKGHNGNPEELVYDRQGVSTAELVIKAPSPTPGRIKPDHSFSGLSEQVPTVNKKRIAGHTIETLLEPSTEYFWSVRSRFKLDGQTRVTKWSYSRIPWVNISETLDPCLEDHIPRGYYHRFKTPKQIE